MKQLVLAGLFAGALMSAQAGGVFVSASFPVYAGYYPAYAYPGYPAYPYVYTRPNYAVEGTLLGAWTGGLIGAGYCQGWQGAGIGAAAGLVLGGIAEATARKQERDWAYASPPPAPPAVVMARPVAQSPPPQRFASPPAPGYQIPDAPRVPDAPTF